MSPADKVRIGILGTGFGSTHAQIYASFPDVEVVGIVGRNEQKTLEVARPLGIMGYTSADSLINNPNVDAIDVCFPTDQHTNSVTAALEHGKDVMCETPVAFNMADAFQMENAARKHGKKLMVALFSRFQSDYKFIHDFVTESHLGKLKSVTANRRTAPVWGDGWDENFIMNLMLHDIDYVYWLLGKPSAVTSRGLQNPGGGWNQVSTSLEYPGAIAMVEGCGIMPASFPFSTGLRIVGVEGALDLDWHWGGTKPFSEIKFYPREGEAQTLHAQDYDPYTAECRYFVDCIHGKADPGLLSIETARESLNIAVAARASLEAGGQRIVIENSQPNITEYKGEFDEIHPGIGT
jgi:predicted dehydrogenase